ncbi:transmembrane protein 138 [Planococcus citri]|uniref:transmembrane protein 138 n=1 Tax=Planococcus citri TaxID=170843 RepID=UPI0031F75C36
MELSKTRYTLTLTIQIGLIFCDLLFNTFSYHFSYNNGLLLLIFLLQDFIQLFTFVVMLITFFQTNVFQAGFMTILCEKFWTVLTASLLYVILTIVLHAWTLIIRWNGESIVNSWPLGFYICFTLHRLISVIYYYIYKRTALRISDQRLYEDEWINHIVHHRNL